MRSLSTDETRSHAQSAGETRPHAPGATPNHGDQGETIDASFLFAIIIFLVKLPLHSRVGIYYLFGPAAPLKHTTHSRAITWIQQDGNLFISSELETVATSLSTVIH